MIVIAFSENRCIISNQIQFIYANFLISVLARTDDIVTTRNRCSDDINLYLLFLLRVCPPPLADFTQLNRKAAILPN